MKKFIFGAIFLVIVGFLFLRQTVPQSKPITQVPKIGEEAPEIQVVAKNLEIPWELAFLPASPDASRGGPDNRIIFTERPGRVRILNQSSQRIEEVAHVGEGGLLGLALHPTFGTNRFVYLYYTYSSGSEIFNKVVRYTLEGGKLVENKTIIEGIPGSINHDGGRIKFGPEGKLYITTGDAAQPKLAQDLNSLAGKILRVNDDGTIPDDNPFDNSPVYSYGHRNPQGLAWDENEKLWASEHGSSAFDEINLIEPGKNYGWPDIRGDAQAAGMEKPFVHSSNSTWAPSGAIIFENSLLFTGLRGGAIFELNLKTKKVTEHFKNQFGRLRTINWGPDGFLYILTSNRDGRGAPSADDDRIIKVNPSTLR